MLLRFFIGLIIAIGIVAGLLAIYMPKEYLLHLIKFRDFFDIAIPILGFGALIKYLCTCKGYCGCKNCTCCNK